MRLPDNAYAHGCHTSDRTKARWWRSEVTHNSEGASQPRNHGDLHPHLERKETRGAGKRICHWALSDQKASTSSEAKKSLASGKGTETLETPPTNVTSSAEQSSSPASTANAKQGREGPAEAFGGKIRPVDSSLSSSDGNAQKTNSKTHVQSKVYKVHIQPETRPLTQDHLVKEVKGIYAGLVMVEKKCVEIDHQQNKTTNEFSDKQWQALITLHRTLLHEHHDFFLASQHPSSSAALGRLATKCAMPARMWRHGIHSFLELLRHRLPDSLEHMLAFIHLTHSMMALLMESVPSFVETWIEYLGDLARYRLAIEEDDLSNREILKHIIPLLSPKSPLYVPNVTFVPGPPNTQQERPLMDDLHLRSQRRILHITAKEECADLDPYSYLPNEDFTKMNKKAKEFLVDPMQSRGQKTLTRWKRQHGQGWSRTWRYCRYMKATKQQNSAFTKRSKQANVHVSWGSVSRIPTIMESRPGVRLGHKEVKWTGNKYVKDRIDEEPLYAGEPLRVVDLHKERHADKAESLNFEEVSNWTAPVGTLQHKNAESLLPYENFIGAFLAPSYRIRQLLRHENHGHLFIAEHLLRPGLRLEAKVYDMKGLSRNMHNYRVRCVKRLERKATHVQTIRQRGRRVVICSTTEAQSSQKIAKDASLDRRGSLAFELAFPPLPRSQALTLPLSTTTSTKAADHLMTDRDAFSKEDAFYPGHLREFQASDAFYKLKALRRALEACIVESELPADATARAKGCRRHCTTPQSTGVEQCQPAGDEDLPGKPKTAHRMEMKRLRQQKYRQKKQHLKEQARCGQ